MRWKHARNEGSQIEKDISVTYIHVLVTVYRSGVQDFLCLVLITLLTLISLIVLKPRSYIRAR